MDCVSLIVALYAMLQHFCSIVCLVQTKGTIPLRRLTVVQVKRAPKKESVFLNRFFPASILLLCFALREARGSLKQANNAFWVGMTRREG